MNNKLPEDDEISLIDLFAVIISYRKLIILITGIVTVISGICLFFIPRMIPSLSGRTVTVSYSVAVTDMPKSVNEYLSTSSTSNAASVPFLASYNLNRLSFLASEQKKFPAFTGEDRQMTGYAYNKYISDLIESKKFEVKQSPLNNTFEVICKVEEKNLQTADALVKDMVAQTNKTLQNYFLPQIQSLQKTVQDSQKDLRSSFSTVTDASSFQKMQMTEKDIETFLADFHGFLSIDAEPFIIPESQKRATKLVIAFFVSFFGSVFLAFALNAVKSIRNDPVEHKKLADAWNAGK